MRKDTFERETRFLFNDSVKKACFIVKAYRDDKGKGFVEQKDFERALDILVAFAYGNADDLREARFHSCGEYCEYKERDVCPGEFQLSGDETLPLCPFHKKKANF